MQFLFTHPDKGARSLNCKQICEHYCFRNVSTASFVAVYLVVSPKPSIVMGQKFTHIRAILRDTCGTGKEYNVHFLLHCPLFTLQRKDLLGQLWNLPNVDNESLDSKTICELLLFGITNVNVILNSIILEATISFIKSAPQMGCVEEIFFIKRLGE